MTNYETGERQRKGIKQTIFNKNKRIKIFNYLIGRLNLKHVPLSDDFSTIKSPLCRRAIFLQIAKLIPVPLNSKPECKRLNISNILS